MPFIACKLPHGLQIEFDGHKLLLLGANIGENLGVLSPNGMPTENRSRVYGYGITEINAAEAELFEKWRNFAMYVDSDPKKGKLSAKGVDASFPALENGAILGPFATRADLENEVKTLLGLVTTGFEGIDTTGVDGVETSDTAPVKPNTSAASAKPKK